MTLYAEASSTLRLSASTTAQLRPGRGCFSGPLEVLGDAIRAPFVLLSVARCIISMEMIKPEFPFDLWRFDPYTALYLTRAK